MNANLTTRKRDVLKLTSFGYSQKEAADQLQISRNTVDVHLKHIKEKTGLQKNTELSLAYVLRTYNLPLTGLPDMLRNRLTSAFVALNFKRLLRLTGANRSSRQTPAPKPIKSVNTEKITMAMFAVLFALFSLAALAGVILGHTYHAYTAILNAAISAICISEYKKIGKL